MAGASGTCIHASIPMPVARRHPTRAIARYESAQNMVAPKVDRCSDWVADLFVLFGAV
jgi:hypothetical protein